MSVMAGRGRKGPPGRSRRDGGPLLVTHLGDLGEAALRDAQVAAPGTVDVLMVPVGAGPTIGPDEAMAIVEATGARLVVPMHYRTERIGFLDPLRRFTRRR